MTDEKRKYELKEISNYKMMMLCDKEVQNDKECVLLSVERNYINLRSATHELRNDKEFIMECIEKDWRCYTCISDELKNDFDIGITALKKSILLISELSINLQIRLNNQYGINWKTLKEGYDLNNLEERIKNVG